MEKIIIVNEDDKIIGAKELEKIKRKDIYRVSALWIENSKEEVLLAQRSFKKKDSPGKWGPAVAGTVEVDENYDLNIYKETEEEIGLKGVKFVKVHKVRRRSGERNYFCQWYFLRIDKDLNFFKIQQEEVEAIQWFKKSDLRKELKLNPDKFLDSVGVTLKKFDNYSS